MKITHVSKIVGIAGTETYLLNLLPALKQKGIEIDFISLVPNSMRGSEAPFKEQLSKHAIKMHTINYSRFIIDAIWKLHQHTKNSEYIHSHLIHADFFCSLVKLIFNRKLCLFSTKHGYKECYMQKHGFTVKNKEKDLYWFILSFSEKFIDKSFAVSKSLRNLFIGLKISKQAKIKVIPLGLALPKNRNMVRSNVSLKTNYQFLIIGRLEKCKGHEHVFNAIKHLKDTGINVNLSIIGSGGYENQLKNIVKELNIEQNINFLGYKINAQLHMQNAEVILIPSIAEGFGVVALEAMASSKPIICFDVPALNEHIIDGDNGYLVECFNTVAFAEQMKKLIFNKELRDKMGARGLKHLKEKYSIEIMLDKTLEFYNLHRS